MPNLLGVVILDFVLEVVLIDPVIVELVVIGFDPYFETFSLDY